MTQEYYPEDWSDPKDDPDGVTNEVIKPFKVPVTPRVGGKPWWMSYTSWQKMKLRQEEARRKAAEGGGE